MHETSLLMEGFNLLTLGMGFVFIFLIFLVFATTLMSRCITRYAPLPSEPKPRTNTHSVPVSTPTQDHQLVAVLTAAIHRHQAQKQAN